MPNSLYLIHIFKKIFLYTRVTECMYSEPSGHQALYLRIYWLDFNQFSQPAWSYTYDIQINIFFITSNFGKIYLQIIFQSKSTSSFYLIFNFESNFLKFCMLPPHPAPINKLVHLLYICRRNCVNKGIVPIWNYQWKISRKSIN